MKRIIVLLLLVLVAACAGPTPPEDRALIPDIEITPPQKDVPPKPRVEPPPTAPDVEELQEIESQAEVNEIQVEARRFEFLPSEIKVKLGERVRLVVMSTDVQHGISIPEFGIDEKLPVGEEVIIEFDADKRGEYTMFCSVTCGSGHRQMRGLLIVE